jgi:epoxyqueuosine reductase QueG
MNDASHNWIGKWMHSRRISLCGTADLREFETPPDDAGIGFPTAISWVVPMSPSIMASIENGPNQAYADEYASVNQLINETAAALESELRMHGHGALALAASMRTDPVGIKGDFPHKTAATRAGLGWIGRHCQLVTRPFGSWVRLGTVFTDAPFPSSAPVSRHFCGNCTRCVEACPAGALTGNAWHPGIAREDILDAKACDEWKKKHYFHFHNGHNCGICSAVCPYGTRLLKQGRA